MSQESIEVFYEATPNPQSMKFRITKQISQESVYFDDPLLAQRSPLAAKLFGFPWASGVYIGADFVTITKQDWVEWTVIAEPLSQLIKEHIESNEPVIVESSSKSGQQGSEDGIEDSDPEVVKKIKRVLNSEIRPAVAMDGGDIIFDRFEEGTLYLEMLGACSGCPSSMVTLKQGVEARLQEIIPEVKEVVAVN